MFGAYVGGEEVGINLGMSCTGVEGMLLSIPCRPLGIGLRNFRFRVEKGFQL